MWSWQPIATVIDAKRSGTEGTPNGREVRSTRRRRSSQHLALRLGLRGHYVSASFHSAAPSRAVPLLCSVVLHSVGPEGFIAGLIQFGLYSLIARISSLSAFVSFQPAVEAVAVGGACVLSGSANPLFDSIFFSLEIDSPSANVSVRSVRI